jgi:manganese transport protein
VWRAVSILPAVGVLALGVDPTTALVASQVALSFGLPFAPFPLLRLTADPGLMDDPVNGRLAQLCVQTATLFVVALLMVALLMVAMNGYLALSSALGWPDHVAESVAWQCFSCDIGATSV